MQMGVIPWQHKTQISGIMLFLGSARRGDICFRPIADVVEVGKNKVYWSSAVLLCSMGRNQISLICRYIEKTFQQACPVVSGDVF